ncbi:MAG: hypothetical protein P0Y49_04715 [Candidatus Pedobacter colombiensis]|uniref:Uncharacterized protein n=1 Tax=Candidatus Pedobacter colombiensis TaxID=3121371 RepID=A0AAJ5W9K8_9SPHI|nr:hypothetical protein [Pedobacter sp.]WEK20439.1 MAG: hypothetical protein P0Y49_04715 [Pedobacter sp.]
MEHKVNRAKALWEHWELREKELGKIGEMTDEHAVDITRQKYDFLREGVYRLSENPLGHETTYREMIRVICDKMQKQLYPNRILRMLHQLKVAVLDRPSHLKAHLELASDNISKLKKAFESRGLEVFANKLDYYLDFERDKISIPVAGQLDAHRTVTLIQDLQKNGKGQYELMGMDASIYGSADPMYDVSIRIDWEFNLNRVQIGNLLQERAVYLYPDKHSGLPKDQWLQVARGHDYGEFRLNVYGSEYGYDLISKLDQLAADTGIYRVMAADVIKQLNDGWQVKLSGRHPADQPVFIEASPGTRGIVIRDIDQKVIGVNEMFLGTKKAEEKERGNSVSKDQSKDNQQDQSLGLGS